MVSYNRKQVALAVERVILDADLADEPGPNGTYPTGATGIFRKRMPERPDRAIVINVYELMDAAPSFDPGIGGQVASVQIRTRVAKASSPLEVDELADSIVHLLHGAHHATWGEVKVERCTYSYGGSIGADSTGREERSDNFRIVIQ